MPPESAFPRPLADQIRSAGIVAVLVIDDVDDAVPLASTLFEGGISAIELTLRTDAAIQSVRRIRAEVPGMIVGVGTILTALQVKAVVAAGGAFGVAPGMNPATVAAAKAAGLPFAPGVCTPTDIELAVESGCRLLKFFPCEPSGGLRFLQSIAAPFEHLGVKFIPLGGIETPNADTYLTDPLVHAIGGSWIAPRQTIRAKNWTLIREHASRASQLLKQVRKQVMIDGAAQ
jgi:2-dehydro-3-deoxyphosphogluconate aldolase / (4S)-4-hydroxy-2-oxoglutarate aldolase